MKHPSIRVIHEEHASLVAVLRSMNLMVERGPEDRPEVFFDLLRAMLFYMDEFPEKQHQLKEDELLFPAVAARSAVARELIDKLAGARTLGRRKIQELQQQLPAWEMLGDSRRPLFEANLRSYVEFCVEHIQLEEKIVIPEALRVLKEADWLQLDANFGNQGEPVGGRYPREPLYDRLYARIAMHSPASLGLGRYHSDWTAFSPLQSAAHGMRA